MGLPISYHDSVYISSCGFPFLQTLQYYYGDPHLTSASLWEFLFLLISCKYSHFHDSAIGSPRAQMPPSCWRGQGCGYVFINNYNILFCCC